MDTAIRSPARSWASRLRAALVLACLLTAGASLAAGLLMPAHAQGARTVAVTEVTGAITPVTAEHLADTVERAAADGHQALVVRLDTPGGLVDATRRIAQSFLDARLPVIVYVSPSGADAGSAGTFITYAGHIAAMAPATTIGAATPVDLEGARSATRSSRTPPRSPRPSPRSAAGTSTSPWRRSATDVR